MQEPTDYAGFGDFETVLLDDLTDPLPQNPDLDEMLANLYLFG